MIDKSLQLTVPGDKYIEPYSLQVRPSSLWLGFSFKLSAGVLSIHSCHPQLREPICKRGACFSRRSASLHCVEVLKKGYRQNTDGIQT